MLKKVIAALLAVLFSAVPLVTAAKTYSKVEVLNIFYQSKLSTGYSLDLHTCDFDFSTSDLQFYIASAYDDGSIDNAWIRHVDHKYKHLTGEIKSKNKKYYQITLQSDADQEDTEFGGLVFKLNIKKKNPYATSHGNVTVTRNDSNDFESCTSEATF